VSKRKRGKSLYEVVSANADKGEKAAKPLGVPGWFGRAGSGAPGDQAKARPGPGAPGSPDRAGPQAQGGSRPVSALEPSRVLSVVGGRLRISLNQVSALVVVVVLALLLAGAFLLGRRSARTPSAGPNAGNESLTERKLPVLPRQRQEQTEQTEPAIVGEPVREKGLWYLVIQVGILKAEHARDIQQFLRQAPNGIETTVHRSKDTGKWMVRDLRGFKDKNSPEAIAYKKRVEQLGEQYFDPKRDRLYKFQGPYFSPES